MQISKAVINSYSQLMVAQGILYKIKMPLRNAYINAYALIKDIRTTTNWVWFPYYHHVFDDERKGFEKHILYLKQYGDIISLDQAVAIINGMEKIKGRYFCITFDDGLRNCYTNAIPILLDHDATAAFFVVVNFTADDERSRIVRPLHNKVNFSFEYLTWKECRDMVAQGMTIGSHTLNHNKLAELSFEQVQKDMVLSKRIIEEKLGSTCDYYACPWGIPGTSFNPERESGIARAYGYKALLTTQRGRNFHKQDLFTLQRDHLFANWSTLQMKYFMTK